MGAGKSTSRNKSTITSKNDNKAARSQEVRPQSVLRWAFRAFAWIDDSLQNILHDHGWPRGSHTQSMIILAVGDGITRPSDLARYLGISRQAIHQALNILIEQNILERRVDPDDGRSKIVGFSPAAAEITRDAVEAIRQIETELEARIGPSIYRTMIRGLSKDWGDPLGGEGSLKTPRIPRRHHGA